MYFYADGMLQAADINPAIAGKTTQDSTNPRLVELEKKEVKTTTEIATGKTVKNISPLVFLGTAAGALLIIAYFQRKLV